MTLPLKLRIRCEIRSVLDPCLEVIAPGSKMLHHEKRVAGRRGVEEYVIILRRHRGARDESREFIKHGDLGRVGSRELLNNRRDCGFGEEIPNGLHNLLSVRERGEPWVNLNRGETGNRFDGAERVPDRLLKDLGEGGGGVSADEQHPLPLARQRDRRGRGD